MKTAAPLALALLAGACHAPASHSTTPAASALAPAAPPKQRGFALYKFGQRIGVEYATIAAERDGRTVVKTTFTFNDRGSDVPLAAEWVLAPDGRPRLYQAWGFVARGTPVDDSVRIGDDGKAEIVRQEEPTRQVQAPAAFAASSGYAPVIGQELLAQAWIAHGRPAHLAHPARR